MHFGEVPVKEAANKILAHKVYDADGKRLFNKGHLLTPADVETLGNHFEVVTVASLSPTDLHENEAAERVGRAIAGDHVSVTAPGVGRANLTAEVWGPVTINVPILERINTIQEGITVATVKNHSLVQPKKLITLVKIIPFGISRDRIEDVEAMARDAGPIISVRELKPRSVGMIVSGPGHMKGNLLDDFGSPVRTRIENYGSKLDALDFAEHDEQAIAPIIRRQAGAGHDMILLAGISAIMDRDDVTPSALQLAGGSVAHFGVPVDPGSLMMLGYIDSIPVLGLPGCIKSPKFSVVDMVLPRLLAGERLTRVDLVEMGHGGLLDDIPDRPVPRNLSEN